MAGARPFGVSLITVVIVISGVLGVIAGVLALLDFTDNVGLISGLIVLAVGLIYLLVARGLWNGSGGARLVVAIVTVISLVNGIWMLITAAGTALERRLQRDRRADRAGASSTASGPAPSSARAPRGERPTRRAELPPAAVGDPHVPAVAMGEADVVLLVGASLLDRHDVVDRRVRGAELLAARARPAGGHRRTCASRTASTCRPAARPPAAIAAVPSERRLGRGSWPARCAARAWACRRCRRSSRLRSCCALPSAHAPPAHRLAQQHGDGHQRQDDDAQGA